MPSLLRSRSFVATPTQLPRRPDTGPGADDLSTEDGFARVAARAYPQSERYTRLEKLGEGGMGIVFAAIDRRLDRKVALKWVRAGTTGEQAQRRRMRLLREARAIAALSHPNIVAVYDVGTVGDDVYVAMEWIDGVDLRRWLAAERRGWREALDVFLQAARGLAAAHAAGIVHRDFKPANVMIGKDGRARVLDFGLARAANSGDEPTDTPMPQSDATLTRTGDRLGTPAYMSPEQHLGHDTGPATDQFSFCVALHHAIYGTRPFRGDTGPSIAAAVLADERTPIPARTDVPPWLRDLVRRGTAREPADRFPSMDALVAFAERGGRRRRAPVLAATIAVAAIAGATVVATGSKERDCTDAPPQASSWPDRRDDVRAAFVAADAPSGASTFTAIDRATVRYEDDLRAAWTDACTRDEVDEIHACLGTRANELAALLDVLAHADAATVELAPIAFAELPRVADCRDVARLRTRTPRPDDAGLAERVAILRTRMAEAEAYRKLGRIDAALAGAHALVAEAAAVGYPPVHAEALAALGTAQSEDGDLEAAEAMLREAAWLAESIGHDAVVADASAELAWLRLLADAPDHEIAALLASAEAAARRADDLDHYAPILVNVDGRRLLDRGQPRQAAEKFREALALQLAHGDPSDPNLPALLHNIGNAQILAGAPELAAWSYAQALELQLRHLGADHPAAYGERQGLADALAESGRPAEAIPLYDAVLAHRESMLGPYDPRLASTLANSGKALVAVGRDDEAIARLDRSLALKRSSGFGPASLARTLRDLARAHDRQGRHADALSLVDEALGLLDPARADQRAEIVNTLALLAELLPHATTDATTRRIAATGERIALAIEDDALGRTLATFR